MACGAEENFSALTIFGCDIQSGEALIPPTVRQKGMKVIERFDRSPLAKAQAAKDAD